MFKTPIPQAAKSCLSQLNNILLKRPPFGGPALGLASLAGLPAEAIYFPSKRETPKMDIYRFRVKRGWYAYALLKDAEDARQYFLDEGHPPDAVGEIEKSEDGQGFEFKMNSIEEKRAWLHPQTSEAR